VIVRLLAYTSPARGHLYPVTPIAAELAARGHDVRLYGLADELAHLEPLGIACSPIDPAIEAIEILDWQERSLRGAGMSALRTFARRSLHEAPDLARAIERHDPDLLVIDINCWGAATVAESSGLPWAMFAPYLLPLRSRDAPPFGMGMRRMDGPAGRIRDAIIARMVGASWDRMAMPTIGKLRAEHGLPAVAQFDDLFACPQLLLSLTAEGFEYPRGDWPANVRLVGPVNWAPIHPSPLSEPSALEDLSDPLVLVTCSTERQRDKRLLHVALEALPSTGMSVIGTAAAYDPAAFHVPPGSRVVRFLAHDPILERAACVICHGGMGITQKALAAGVPVVVVPFGRDQLETARRVEFAGAGVRISPRRLTPERLTRAVSEAIGMREGAQRVARAYTAAGGAMAAADAIETLAP
jgi:MGT family glycosyltransferase